MGTKPKILGGIFLQNVLKGVGDPYLDFQLQLIKEGRLDGIQIVVPHPSQTPETTADNVKMALEQLGNIDFFWHLGAESCGVDQGERFDEFGEFAKQRPTSGFPWGIWNRQTLKWGLEVANIAAELRSIPSDQIIAVMHPGYGYSMYDEEAREKVLAIARELGPQVALEVVPPNVQEWYWRHYRHMEVNWPRPSYWGFGGTPDDMHDLLDQLGPTYRCLIDFTHVIVAYHQVYDNHLAKAAGPDFAGMLGCTLGSLIAEFCDLPITHTCHYSGSPDFPADSHDFCHVPIPEPIETAMSNWMETICLELRWNPKEADKFRYLIDTFKEDMDS